jgi:O-antigen ligase
VALTGAVAFVIVQLVPLPAATLSRVSPATVAFLRHYDVVYNSQSASAGAPAHAISIDPSATGLGLAFLVALSLFVLGTAAYLPRVRLSRLARALVVLGLAVAVFGIVQRATFNGRIYWVWTPRAAYAAVNSFGPFVNRNHFAGWMLMTASVTGGYLLAMLARAGGGESTWRRRAVWVSSADGSWLAFTSFSFLVMALSIVWTLSRSGIAALAVVAMLLAGGCAVRFRGSLRVAGAVVLVAAIGFAVAWKGTGLVSAWYGNTGTLAWRLQVWRDTLRIAHDFWLFGTGLDTYGVATLVYPMSAPNLHIIEAHNDYLQILAEGGAVLLFVVLAAVAAVANRIRRAFAEPQPESTYWIRAGATVGLLGIAVQELSDFSLQMPGNAVMFAVLVAIAIHRARN